MIGLLFMLIVLGAVVWFVEAALPMPATFKLGIRLVVGVIVIWYLLLLLGLHWPAPGSL